MTLSSAGSAASASNDHGPGQNQIVSAVRPPLKPAQTCGIGAGGIDQRQRLGRGAVGIPSPAMIGRSPAPRAQLAERAGAGLVQTRSRANGADDRGHAFGSGQDARA